MHRHLLVVLVLLSSSAALAADNGKYPMYLGVGGGYVIPTGTTGANVPAFSLEYGAKFRHFIGSSLFANYYYQATTSGAAPYGVNSANNSLNLLAQVNFFVSLLRLGLDGGVTYYAGNNTSNGATGFYGTFGFNAGLDIPLAPLSLGIETNYLFNTGTGAQNGLLIAQASIKFWF